MGSGRLPGGLRALCDDLVHDLICTKLPPTDGRGLVPSPIILAPILDGGGDLAVVVDGAARPLEFAPLSVPQKHG